MVSRVKRWSMGIAGVVGLLLALAVAAPWLIDVNDYRSEIATEIGQRIGRQVTIAGDIGLSVVPWLGIELDDVRLANARGFGPAPFAAVRHLRVRVRFWPLFSRRLVMDTVTVDGLRLDLAIDTEGRSNWQDLVSRSPSSPAVSTGEAPRATAGAHPGTALAALTLGGIDIVDARLVWRDERSAIRVTLAPLSLRSGPIAPGRPVDLSLHTRIDSASPAVSADLSIRARATFDPTARRLDLDGLHVETDADWVARRLKGHGRLDGRLAIDLGGRTLAVSGLRLDVQATAPSLPGGQARLGADTDLVADLAAGRVRLTRLGLELAGVRIDGQGTLSGIGRQPRFTGHVRVPAFEPRPVLEGLAVTLPEMADGSALHKAGLETDVSATPARLDLSKLRLVVDDSTLTGHLGIEHFERPAITFDLDLDGIDLDRYLPPPAKGRPTAPATPVSAGAAAGTALPVDTLRRLAIDGDLHIGRLRVTRLSIEGLRLGLHADKGLIRLDPVSARLYRGRYRGRMRLDVRHLPPRLTVDERLDGVDLDPLTRDLTGDRLAFGRGDLVFRAHGRGERPERLVASLAGQARIDLRNGGIHGVALGRLLADSGLVEGRDLRGLTAQEQTVFRRLSASFHIADGVLPTEDLDLDSAQLDARGRGRIDLPKRTLDLHVEVHARKQLARVLGDLGGVAIPVRVTGALSAPTVRLDTQALLKSQLAIQRRRLRQRLEREKKARLDEARRRVEQKARERVDREKKRLEERLRKSLKGLF